jgi:hypothetical protein
MVGGPSKGPVPECSVPTNSSQSPRAVGAV